MSSESSHSVAGGWLGAYYYESRTRTPVRFEATFARLTGEQGSGERFGGSILDDEGGSGSAVVSHGVQQENFVRFVKVPNPPAPGLFPANYVGTLSEDGRVITGHWKITLGESRRGRAREIVGTWEARRLWHASDDETSREAGAESELTPAK
ncbi:MAG: hypothetical protein H7145_06995 [Akkermansiaceae bacterium]|nr:hypothetical protein [Armatimonadota bacterium]